MVVVAVPVECLHRLQVHGGDPLGLVLRDLGEALAAAARGLAARSSWRSRSKLGTMPQLPSASLSRRSRSERPARAVRRVDRRGPPSMATSLTPAAAAASRAARRAGVHRGSSRRNRAQNAATCGCYGAGRIDSARPTPAPRRAPETKRRAVPSHAHAFPVSAGRRARDHGARSSESGSCRTPLVFRIVCLPRPASSTRV